MMQDQRIAILYWGLTRSTKYVYETHRQHVFDILTQQGIPFDVYLHTWKTTDGRVWWNSPNIDPDYNEHELLCPTGYRIDDQNEYLDTIDFAQYFYEHEREQEWEPRLLQNHLCALESQRRVTTMCLNSNVKYTHVVYLRPDVRIIDDLPVFQIMACDGNRIILPDNNHYEGYNDRFAAMRFEAVLWYGYRNRRLMEFRQKWGRIVSEKYVKYVVDLYYKPEFVCFRFVLVRPDRTEA